MKYIRVMKMSKKVIIKLPLLEMRCMIQRKRKKELKKKVSYENEINLRNYLVPREAFGRRRRLFIFKEMS